LRFNLNFITTVINPETLPVGLTERRFRDFWDRTDKCGGNEWLYSVPRPVHGVRVPRADEIGAPSAGHPEFCAPAAHGVVKGILCVAGYPYAAAGAWRESVPSRWA
jgi:hypothetical protein